MGTVKLCEEPLTALVARPEDHQKLWDGGFIIAWIQLELHAPNTLSKHLWKRNKHKHSTSFYGIVIFGHNARYFSYVDIVSLFLQEPLKTVSNFLQVWELWCDVISYYSSIRGAAAGAGRWLAHLRIFSSVIVTVQNISAGNAGYGSPHCCSQE